MTARPRRVEPRFVERVWGRTDLAPLFGPQEKKIGEVWFPLADSFPLLVKFLFTDERHSVQVHPDDEYAKLHENSRGKTEMWHILHAKPEGRIALGFRTVVSEEQLRSAVADGTVEELLQWVPVQPGDTVLVGAGVVHALGAGVMLCEIQQNSDVTYRLYDYGRPRELHLDKGIAVAKRGPYYGRRELPVRCDQFTTEMVRVEGSIDSDVAGEYLLIVLDGCGSIDTQPFQAGEVWHVPAGAGAVRLETADASTMLRTRAGSPEA
jgi:mannose-6-phosphate isomerase